MDTVLEKGEDLFKHITQFHLDEDGKFKYILIQFKFKEQILYFVRGQKKFNFHMENFEQFVSDLRNCGLNFQKFEYEDDGDIVNCQASGIPLTFTCVGGGRVQISKSNKSLFIFGYSQSFGRAEHVIAQEIAKQYLKDFPQENFTWSNEGY